MSNDNNNFEFEFQFHLNLIIICIWKLEYLVNRIVPLQYITSIAFIDFIDIKPNVIMKRKFKQWWSSIPPILTKQTITSHLNRTYVLNMFTYEYFSQFYVFKYLRIFPFFRDGKETTAEGDGFIPDPKDPARLKIQFAKGKFIQKN